MDMNLSKLWKILEDGGVWQANVHGVAKSQTRFSNNDLTTTTERKPSPGSTDPQALQSRCQQKMYLCKSASIRKTIQQQQQANFKDLHVRP